MPFTRSDFLWGNGPEWEPEEETREERLMRLEREEMKTRILANNNKMLADILNGWTYHDRTG
jgi:hypothetical protein